MDITTVIENIAAVLELVFFVLTMYSLVTGLKSKNYDNLKKYGIMYLILNFIRRIYTFAMKEAVAVSIIGGADGPTSIFLAGKVGGTSSMILYLLSLVVILIGVGIVICLKKKKVVALQKKILYTDENTFDKRRKL